MIPGFPADIGELLQYLGLCEIFSDLEQISTKGQCRRLRSSKSDNFGSRCLIECEKQHNVFAGGKKKLLILVTRKADHNIKIISLRC